MTRRYASKLRYGRGFSLQELRAAKLTPQFARTVGIAVDHRRQDTSEEAL
jgi:large subunit ribosomal protein L13e